MAKYDEISSTEKLLDLIRGKKDKALDSSEISLPPSSPGTLKPLLLKVFPAKKKVTVGVDIGDTDLKLVAMSRSSGKEPELLDYINLPFEADISKNSKQFPSFLQSALTGFCGDLKNVEIWTSISSANVDTRYLRIPRVLKKQAANAVYWTYRKEVSFNERTQIFDFEILGDVVDNGVKKIEVLAYAAPKQEIDELKDIFFKAGFPLAGISIIPFAIQNLLRTGWIETAGKNICSLFIGKDWSRIAIFSNGNLVLSRDIKAGIQSMIEAIMEEIGNNSSLPSEGMVDVENAEMAGTSDKAQNTVEDKARKIFFDFIYNSSSLLMEGDKPGLNEDKIFSIIQPALERVIRQVEKTVEHYSLNFANESISEIFISGETSKHRRIVDYINSQLDIPIRAIDPFGTVSSFPDKFADQDQASEREDFVPSTGLALSSDLLTPNLLFTHKDKQKTARLFYIKRTIFTVFLLVAGLSTGVYLVQGRLIEQKKAQIFKLQEKMDKFSPRVDQNLILKAVAQINRKKTAVKEFSNKYLALAVISEISKMTPSNIRLLDITAGFGKPAAYKEADKNSKAQKRAIICDGIVFGDRLTFEGTLAGYLIKLKNSPMFNKPSITKRSFETFEDKEVLRFTARLELAKKL